LSRAALRSKRNTPSAVIIPKKIRPVYPAVEPHQAMRFIAFLERFTLT
jgi:hypothetical protein